MVAKRVRCPQCTVILDVPVEYKGTKIRCSVCRAGFRLPGVSDAEILDWIGPESKEDTAHAAAAASPTMKALERPRRNTRVMNHRKGNFSAGSEGFMLMRVGHQGVLFEFPATLLEDKSFRSAMPRCCLRCGTNAQLRPHVIIFGNLMKESSSMEAEYLDSPGELSEREARNMSIKEVLERLPMINKIPPPANLPMPYWICDMCSPFNMVFAQNKIHAKTGEGICRLRIQRLWRAEEFLVQAGGKNTEAHDEILDALEENPEKPWDMLAGIIQQRLQQWYNPHRGERFVSYTPDRTHTRTEDGMTGVVVSSRRLIYNSSLQQRESEKGEPLELNFTRPSGKLTLHIKGPTWEIKDMVVDKSGLAILRRALTKEGFSAVWH